MKSWTFEIAFNRMFQALSEFPKIFDFISLFDTRRHLGIKFTYSMDISRNPHETICIHRSFMQASTVGLYRNYISTGRMGKRLSRRAKERDSSKIHIVHKAYFATDVYIHIHTVYVHAGRSTRTSADK